MKISVPRCANIYNNALWTLHDVMHRVNEDQFGTDRFDEKSFEENEDEKLKLT